MREIIAEANDWRSAGQPIALATVVKTWGSAPRKIGAKMALTPGGALAGSVSGGCVEGAVFEAGVTALAAGRAELLEFGVADETAWTVGLACGGRIDVFVEPFDAALQATVADWIAREAAGVVATVVRGAPHLIGRKLLLHAGQTQGSIDPALDAAVAQQAAAALAARKPLRSALADSAVEVFYDVLMPSPQLIIVGGVHIAQALVELAQIVGFRPIVIDPRRAFGSTARFPNVALYPEWPRKAFEKIALNEATAVALLTHDPKIDDQALEQILPSPAFYIGALGSSKTADKRRQRLAAAGYAPAQLARIHGPIGLDIGAETPEEIALAVMAEVIRAYRA